MTVTVAVGTTVGTVGIVMTIGSHEVVTVEALGNVIVGTLGS